MRRQAGSSSWAPGLLTVGYALGLVGSLLYTWVLRSRFIGGRVVHLLREAGSYNERKGGIYVEKLNTRYSSEQEKSKQAREVAALSVRGPTF